MRSINLIVVHCTATVEGRDHDIDDVAKWHKARGFKAVGYHYLVKLDGVVEAGRPEHQVGAHVDGHNTNSIGVCYVGGLGLQDGRAKDTRTSAQKRSLESLLRDLKRRYPRAHIVGHRDLSPDKDGDGTVERHEWMKACPSFNAAEEYATL